MAPSPSHSLTGLQKWSLGFSLAIIYVPLRIYMNVSVINQEIFIGRLPLWAIEILVSVIFFTFWINVIEWLQRLLYESFGDLFLFELRFVNQATVLLIAIVLAVMFNYAFRYLWHWLEILLDAQIVHVMSPEERRNRLLVIMEHRRANNAITVMALMAAFYLSANRRVYEKLQLANSNSERLEKENIRAQFNALKNQVSPHFMFNNFSVLSSLVETDPVRSAEFVRSLSNAYRYILEQSAFDHIKLRTEMDFLKTYSFLLKTRFEEKIHIDAQVTEAEKDRFSIVPLTLQLLVENAVKHNQMSSRNPLTVVISISNGILQVANPIQLRPPTEPSTGVGLQNIVNRYKLLTNQPVLFGEENGNFVVRIPLIS